MRKVFKRYSLAKQSADAHKFRGRHVYIKISRKIVYIDARAQYHLKAIDRLIEPQIAVPMS